MKKMTAGWMYKNSLETPQKSFLSAHSKLLFVFDRMWTFQAVTVFEAFHLPCLGVLSRYAHTSG